MNLTSMQAVGYSRSSLPRGAQYNTQTKQMTIYTNYKKQLTNTTYSNKTKTYNISF